jgi:hypothetical protein
MAILNKAIGFIAVIMLVQGILYNPLPVILHREKKE